MIINYRQFKKQTTKYMKYLDKFQNNLKLGKLMAKNIYIIFFLS